MSIESAKAFLQKIAYDESFVKRLEQCIDIEDRMDLLKRLGYKFTNEELGKFKKRYKDRVWFLAWYHEGNLISYNL